MSKHRVLLVLPLLAGLLITGTAVAQMMPRDTVRDSVYQTGASGHPACVHNGVHFNKQGHPNCGLHKGWGNGGSTGDEGTTTASGGGHGHPGGGHESNGAGGHGKGGGHGHAGTNHAHGGQGHGHSGESHGNSGSHGHHGKG
jgi:hypothetical protein